MNTGTKAKENLYKCDFDPAFEQVPRPVRVGLLVPSSNTTMEREFWSAAPTGVSIHSARMRIEEATEAALTAMDRDLEGAVDLLLTAGVDVLCYGCTSGSFIQGRDHASSLRQRLERRTGIPCAVTSEAVVEGLRLAEVTKVVVATPYIDSINEKERHFLDAHGFEVLGIRGLGLVQNLTIGVSPLEETARLAQGLVADFPQAEGIFISCTNLPTFPIIEHLSQTTGRPVVTSNQASLWMACRLGGVSGRFWSLQC